MLPSKSEVSSFGFSGTNGHGLMEATLSTVEPPQRAPMKFARKASKIRGKIGRCNGDGNLRVCQNMFQTKECYVL